MSIAPAFCSIEVSAVYPLHCSEYGSTKCQVKGLNPD